MRNMKEKEYWWGESFKSQYEKKDYKSFYYKGNWNNQLLNEAMNIAIKKKCSIYEVLPQLYKNKKEHFPKKLVKFFPMNLNSLKCIENNSVYLNEASKFNDPYDCFLNTNRESFIKEFVINSIRENNINIPEAKYNDILLSVTYDPFRKMNLNHHKCFSNVIIDIAMDGGRH